MEKKRALFYCIIVILILSVLYGCNVKDYTVSLDNHDVNIEEIVKYLSSDQLFGRLTGTQGNQDATLYINEYFGKIGLDKNNSNSYMIPYNHLFYDLTSQSTLMRINFNDGTVKNCILGKDFHPQNLIKNIKLSLPITFNLNDENLQNTIAVIEDSNEIIRFYNKSQGILVKQDNFKKYINVRSSGFPIIQISPELYKLLQDKLGNVHIEYNLIPEKIIANNIVGVIKGTDNRNAIVISAHFDHVGHNDYCTYNGAIDNASGIGTLIKTAKKIKAYSDSKKLSSDIIICAFNGEESFLQGSKAFVEAINKNYSNIINVNIDCIGLKEDSNILITGEGNVSKNLITSAESFFTKNGYKVDVDFEGSLVSDYISFSQNDIPSVNISQTNIKDIHSNLDVYELIDFGYLYKFSDKLAEYIISIEKDFFDFNTSEKEHEHENHIHNDNYYIDDENIIEAIESSKEELKFNEYKFIKIEDKVYITYNGVGVFYGLSDLKEILPELSIIPERINEYEFNQFTVAFSPIILYEDNDVEINKVYNYDNVSIKDLTYISIEYFNDSKDSNYINMSFFSPKEKNRVINSFYDEDSIVRKEILFEDREISILYTENQQQIISIETNFDVNNRNGIVGINNYIFDNIEHEGKKLVIRKPCWSESTVEYVTNFVKNHDLHTLINDIVKGIYGETKDD